MAAKIAATRLTPTLRDLKIEKSGFTVPWAMWVKPDRTCYLNLDYSVGGDTTGTRTMYVTHTERGYEVTLIGISYEWSVAAQNPYHWWGRYVEVVAIKDTHKSED